MPHITSATLEHSAPDTSLRVQQILALLARTAPRLRDYVVHLTRDLDEADDVVQDCWVRALRRGSTYDGRGSFEGWLLRIAKNIWLRRMAEARTTRLHLGEYAAFEQRCGFQESLQQDSAIERDELEDELTSAVLELPLRQRAVTIAYYYERQPVAAIAARFGIRRGTVMATLWKARRSLGARLHVGLSE